MEIEINKIICVRGAGADVLLLETTLPNGCYPFTGTATVKMDVAAETAEKYCEENFSSVELKIVEGG